jgi:hypothetical protein
MMSSPGPPAPNESRREVCDVQRRYFGTCAGSEDILSSARFYQEAGGLRPEKEVNGKWAWFWAGAPGEAQRISLRKGPLLSTLVS